MVTNSNPVRSRFTFSYSTYRAQHMPSRIIPSIFYGLMFYGLMFYDVDGTGEGLLTVH